VEAAGAVTVFRQKGQATGRADHWSSTSIGCEQAGHRNWIDMLRKVPAAIGGGQPGEQAAIPRPGGEK